MDFKKTHCECRDFVATICMDSPANLNAIDVDMANELLERLSQVEKDPDARVVIIASAAKAFSAGGDVGYFYSQIRDGGKLDLKDLFDMVGQISLRIKQMKKIVITAVNGAAAGAGANLALSGDFIFAAENTKFIQAFINLGLVTDTGGAYLLSKMIGAQRAFELCTTGRALEAGEAKDLGIVYEICAKDELSEKAFEYAKKLASGPLFAYEQMKKQFFAVNFADYESYLKNTEIPTQCACQATKDFAEGVSAFMEKRPAVFKGE